MAMASPLVGVASCSKGPHAKGRPTAARPLAKGQPAMARASPQGAATARSHAAGAAANGLQTVARSQPGRGDRLWVRRPQEGSLRVEAPPTR
ncbi:hypothetical protein B296_00021063, partial [Ensete ventricosum]